MFRKPNRSRRPTSNGMMEVSDAAAVVKNLDLVIAVDVLVGSRRRFEIAGVGKTVVMTRIDRGTLRLAEAGK